MGFGGRSTKYDFIYFLIFTPLASYQSVGTKTRRHPPKLGLFLDYRKVGLFKEDGLKLGLFI